MRRLLDWLFRNRQTGEITIAQMPNPALWIVLVGSVVSWVWHPPGRMGLNLDGLVKASLVVWAVDELCRGVNPWRRCLGAALLVYVIATVEWTQGGVSSSLGAGNADRLTCINGHWRLLADAW